MKLSELYEALHALIAERVPLHTWGACGVGKSQIVSQVAAELKCQFLDIRAVQLDPVDLRGLPRISADRAEWVPPRFLPIDGQGILFLDELTYQLILDRKLGEYRLPDDWVVIAAGNPASERGVHFSMPRPPRNRFVHLDLEPDFMEWCKWAIKVAIRPEIIAFLRFKPALLHDADATSDVNAWPTPRSWEMASTVLNGFTRRQQSGFFAGTTEIEAQLVEGTIGEAATTELIAFLRLLRTAAPIRSAVNERHLIQHERQLSGSLPHISNCQLIGEVYQTPQLCCFRKHLLDSMQHELGRALRPKAMPV